jgi:hypothetical protein
MVLICSGLTFRTPSLAPASKYEAFEHVLQVHFRRLSKASLSHAGNGQQFTAPIEADGISIWIH